mgnify:CR=1 FL=1
MPLNYTMVTVPEPCDFLMFRHLARREGRFVGYCMFCRKEYREVDFKRGLLVYGNCKLWCWDTAECSESMEAHRFWVAPAPAAPPEPPAPPDRTVLQWKKTHDAVDAELEAYYSDKRVRFSPRRGAPGDVVPLLDPPRSIAFKFS